MKKCYLLILAVIGLAFTAAAQQNATDRELAIQLIRSHAKELGLTDAEISETLISSTYVRPETGIRMVYSQQTFRGIPVFNQMQVLAFRNNQLLSNTGGRIRNIDEVIDPVHARPLITATDAVRSALAEAGITALNIPQPANRPDGKLDFGKMGISLYDVVVEQVWLPVINSKQVILTWQVELAPEKSSDHWLIRVDASTGRVADKNNYTVFENFDQLAKDVQERNEGHSDHHHAAAISSGAVEGTGPLAVNNASYRVIPFPAESPIHPGGTQTLVNNPWTLAGGNATSLGWHYDGSVYHDSTRGNNVWAQEDRDANNVNGKAGLSSTAQPNLLFDNSYDYAQAPTVNVNQQMAITNLFYWNNLVHDITYLYGFDEPSGNFQNNNQGRGGAGNDYVVADAQDAGGTNNANFSTPADGSKPRMQMYLWTGVTPNRDGDLDNGIIIHEYAHGISNRLTGGPANSSCLGNAEQGGEGWSDYFALMYTHNWATAQVTDGTIPRGIGTYALNQAYTGQGIRLYKYTTDMSVNPWTYAMMATTTNGAVHRIGELWCTMLWDMTWEMIAQDGINPDIFNPGGTGGNTAALKLVVEGMRLQPCSPGFVDARNAILRADTLFYGGKYSCAIWRAFARRGLGVLASQGSSNSYTDQVANYLSAGSAQISLTQSVSQQQEGLQVTYTNRVTSGACGGISNYLLTDTLPANVTYVSGGMYNSSNRVVSFTVNQAAGQSQDYSFTVQINNGTYFPADTLLNEKLTGAAGTIPSGWTAASTTGSVWTTHNTRSYSAPNSFFTPNSTASSEQTLSTSSSFALGSNPSELSFWHWYNSESGWDGGVVEISTNNGASWTDLGAAMTQNGYNSSLGNGSALAGRSAFSGNSGAFIRTIVNLSSYTNTSARFRFRFASDNSVAATGWNIDDILLSSKAAQVNIKSNLFNDLGGQINIATISTLILPASPCGAGTTVSVSGQPAASAVCEGANTSFSIVSSGPDPVYQWQVSTDGGNSYANISGANTATLTLTGVTASMSGNRYRCQVGNICTVPAVNSDAAVLAVNSRPLPPSPSGGIAACGSGAINLTAIPAQGQTVDWYAGPAGGTALLTGSSSFTTPVLTSTTTYYAEARDLATGCISVTRSALTATVNPLPAAPSGSGGSRCGQGSVTLGASAPAGIEIDWYVVPSGGIAVASGTNTYNTGTLLATTTYYAEARSAATGCKSSSRTPVTATVKQNTSSSTAVSICNSDLPYDWNGQSYTEGGVYNVTLTNSEGCDSVATLLLDIAPAIQVLTVTGGGSYISGGAGLPVGLSTSQLGINYQLYLNGSPVGSTVTGNGSSISFGNQTAAGTYTVQGLSPLCQAFMANSVSITVTQPTVPIAFSVTGGGTYCSGGTGLEIGLSGSETGVSYQLRRSNGTINVGTPVQGTGAAISFGLQTATGDYSVLATNNQTSVSQSMLNSVMIRVAGSKAPSAPGAVSGPTDVCSYVGGAPVVYHISQASNATSYLWTAPAGATIIGSNTDTAVSIFYPASFTGGTLSVMSVNACFNNATSSARNVTIRKLVPGTPGTITSSVSNPCAIVGTNSTATYTIRKVTYATGYDWTLSNGITFVSNYGDTGVIVRFAQGFTTGTISVRATNSCSVSAARTITVTSVVPAAPASISGSVAVCDYVGQASTASYSISPVSGADSYFWTVPANASIQSGQGTTNIQVSYLSGFTSGAISVTSVAPCGSSTARSLTVAATKPATPAVINGPTQVCSYVTQATNASYSITPVTGAASYLWTPPANTTIVSGQGTSSIQLSFATGFTTGSLTVKSVSNCGTSTTRSLALTKMPGRPAAITASAAPCPTTTVTYSISPIANATSYYWTLPVNATYVSGQGTTSLTVTFNASFTTGRVSVKSINDCGNSSNTTLQLDAATCVPARFSESEPVQADIAGGISISQVFPNPSNGDFRVNLRNPGITGKLKIQMIDMYGRVVHEQYEPIVKTGSAGINIHAAHLPAGIYELRCYINDKLATGRVLIAK